MKFIALDFCQLKNMSPLAMAEWIEIISIYLEDLSSGSPLAMAEWIEIQKQTIVTVGLIVSASDGGVD